MNEAMKVLLTRRSIRSYKPDQIKDEDLFEVVEAGKFAANGMGKQSAFFVVVQNEEDRKTISKISSKVRQNDADSFYGAPTYILVFCDPNVGTGIKDGSCAISNMLSAAHSLGLGSCWVDNIKEVFEDEEGKKLLHKWGITQPLIGVGSCILGYIDGAYPEAKPRKANFVEYVK